MKKITKKMTAYEVLANSVIVVSNTIEQIVLKVVASREDGILGGIDPHDRFYTITKGASNRYTVTKVNGKQEEIYYNGINGYLCVPESVSSFCRSLKQICEEVFDTKMTWYGKSNAPAPDTKFYVSPKRHKDARGEELNTENCSPYALIIAYMKKSGITDFNAAKLALITEITNCSEN